MSTSATPYSVFNDGWDGVSDLREQVQTADLETSIALGTLSWESTQSSVLVSLAVDIPDGFVLFHGEDVAATELGSIKISDITPTVLHWMGEAVPEDVDGDVVLSAFEDGSPTATREVRTRSLLPDRGSGSSRGELDTDVEERLEDIGHIE